MPAALVNASKRWLNQRLMRRFHLRAQRPVGITLQRGAVMFEAVTMLSVASVIAGSALHFHTQAQRQALVSQVTQSASAFASAVNMQRAVAALGQDRLSLVYNASGFPISGSSTSTMSDESCESLWRALVVAIDVGAPALDQLKAGDNRWQARNEGASCEYTFSAPVVGTGGFRYSSTTGDVSLLAFNFR